MSRDSYAFELMGTALSRDEPPKQVKEAIEVLKQWFGLTGDGPGGVYQAMLFSAYVNALDPGKKGKIDEEMALIMQIAEAISAMGPGKETALLEENVEQLLELYMRAQQRAEVDLDLERDNAALRARYLKETPAYTAAQIREIQTGALPKNRSDPAARWKREDRVFAIPYLSGDLFPAFQFRDGTPHPTVKAVLKALPEGLTAWQVALWFSAANRWLDSEPPARSLDNRDQVVEAAKHFHDQMVG
jgi:hypothetical protein